MILQLFLLVYFQYFYLLELLVFAYLFILNGSKVKNCLKYIYTDLLCTRLGRDY